MRLLNMASTSNQHTYLWKSTQRKSTATSAKSTSTPTASQTHRDGYQKAAALAASLVYSI